MAGSQVGANVISRWRCRERRDWGQLKGRKRRSVKKLKKKGRLVGRRKGIKVVGKRRGGCVGK